MDGNEKKKKKRNGEKEMEIFYSVKKANSYHLNKKKHV